MDSSATDSLNHTSLRRLRIRELSRYYCITSSRPSSPNRRHIANKARKDGSSAQRSQKLPSKSRPLVNQPQLVALAQLAILRTNTERSLISIIDDETQFIVAEATRSVSVYDPNAHDPGDGPLIGAQAIKSQHGVCPQSLDAFLGTELNFSDPNNSADKDHVFIHDLLSEKLTCSQPLLKQLPPVLRYYLDVPLKSESGHVLGSICVIDSTSRSLSVKDVDQLAEVAKLVVEHLEYTRLKEDHSRAQRLLEGLSHFVQGQSSLSLWSRSTPGQEDIPEIQINPVAISSATLSPKHIPYDDTVTGTHVSVKSNETSSVTSTKPSNQVTSEILTNMNSTNASSVLSQGMAVTDEVQPLTMVTDVKNDPASEDMRRSDSQLATSSSGDIRQVFSRASNLIRESMELDATCFLELPQNARAGRVRGSSSKMTDSQAQDVAALADTESLTDSSMETSTRETVSKQDSQTWETELYCHRLGFSTSINSSVAESNVTPRFLTIPAGLLSTLAEKYPGGHIFHFDEAGVITSSGDEQTPRSHNGRPQYRRKVADKLFAYFQNARSMIFFPVYDNDRQHVYAAFIGWTNNPARALQHNEIVYVSAFADSLMSEVMRLGAVAIGQAKSDFISSISHELRSPLHGIVAACQLLSESERYPHQAEFIDMIHTCAHTLLDTMDHVLDYAKINHFTQQQEQRRSSTQRRSVDGPPSDKGSYSLISRVDLAVMVEDTVMSIAAGSQQMPARVGEVDQRQGTVLDPGQPAGQLRGAPIPILLNIHPYPTWLFDTEPGSWRRIIMNLVGNSIKYTSHGHISVDLRCYDTRDKDASNVCMAELKVTDTGRGISEQYLRHRLYTPFAQENNLSVGSGLGLSMVNQIVISLRGQMQVQSEVDSGTQIVVRIPLQRSAIRNLVNLPNEAPGPSMVHSIAFAGFDGHPPLSESATGIPSPRRATLLALKRSISNMAIELLGLHVVQNDPDIYVIEESFLMSQLEEYDVSKNTLLVVGLDGRQSSTIERLRNARHRYLLPPLGPERMKDVLRSLMDKDATAADDHAESHHEQDQPQEQSTAALSSSLNHPPVSSRNDDSSTGGDSSLCHTVQSINNEHHHRAEPVQCDVTDPGSSDVPGQPTSEAKASHIAKSSVLLVDDNDINLRILVACVKRLRIINYITATNGREALEKFRATIENGDTIPVVLMDISMPVMDGLESTRQIRAYEKSRAIKGAVQSRIIAVTGLGSNEAQKDIEGCGFDLYLRKPVNLQIIRELLTESGMIMSD